MHFMFNNLFFLMWKFVSFMEKYCVVGQAIDDNMAHAHCILDTSVYKHTLSLFPSFYLATAALVTRTRLIVTLYVHCLSCCSIINDKYLAVLRKAVD